MKAFLLAAGHGTRLRPITNSIPKCLVPIRGIPLLGIWLELCRYHGIDEVLINLHSHARTVSEFVTSNSNGVKVQLSHEPTLLGSAGTLLANRDWVASEPCFWVFYADVLTTTNLSRMMDLHRQHEGAATLGVYEVTDPSRCGIAVVDESGIIQQFKEKPRILLGNLAFAGILIANPELLDVIPPYEPADLGFDVLPRLAGRMFAYTISDYLLDIGTMENYKAAQDSWPGLHFPVCKKD